MDYRLRHKKSELDSTGYIEIGPGKYTGSHWEDGFVFVKDDTFGLVEGIVAKYCPSYDHLGMNDLPKATAMKIISEWRSVADRLPDRDRSGVQRELNLSDAHLAYLGAEIESNRFAIADFLRSLADECERFLHQNDWMCILGV